MATGGRTTAPARPARCARRNHRAGGSGGGIANLDGWSWFWGRAWVTDNTAEQQGGGVFVYFGSGGVCSPHVRLCPNTPDDPPFEIGC